VPCRARGLKAYELKRVDEDYFVDDERLSSS